MPLRIQRDVIEIETVLNEILNTKNHPIGQCRLLSSGFNPGHALNISEDISGHKECIGCGNCIDICPFLFREPSRREKTEQRTSMALESAASPTTSPGTPTPAPNAVTASTAATSTMGAAGNPSRRAASGSSSKSIWKAERKSTSTRSTRSSLAQPARSVTSSARWSCRSSQAGSRCAAN